MLMTECRRGQEKLIKQLMIELVSLLSEMVVVIEFLQDSGVEQTNDCLYQNLEKFAPQALMSLEKLSPAPSILLAETRSWLLSQRPKEERGTSTISQNNQKP